ncbi:Trx-2 [Anthophora plagiata]
MAILIEDFDQLKQKFEEAGDKLVIVDFFAVWCGPCKMFAPHFDALAQEMKDVVFLKVDVDECEELNVAFHITSMPTFIFIKNGKEVDRLSGVNQEKFHSLIEKHK